MAAILSGPQCVNVDVVDDNNHDKSDGGDVCWSMN